MSYATRNGHRWLLRILAILFGLSPFIAAEVGLRLAGMGRPTGSDPFVELAARPLFELDAAGDRYAIPASRQRFFKPDSFAARKPPREFRIFCLGGSTVQGNPYSIETSFTTWLELSLRAAQPNRDWEVVNCGGISYASYRLLPILRECLQHQPDLLVLYIGDNEFLEDRSYHQLLHLSPTWKWVNQAAAHSHLFQALQEWNRDRDAPPRLSDEVDAVLDYEGGLAHYHRDDAWQRGVAHHFHHALASMIQAAQQAKVPVLLVDPVSNIKDCPPFKAATDPRLSERERRQLADLLESATATQAANAAGLDPTIEPPASTSRRIEALEKARNIDERDAGIQFRLGRAYLEAGRDEEARRALLRAKDEDICPLRLTEPLRAIIDTVAEDFQIPVVPVLREFDQRSPHGITGDEMMLDHVHPTISGHQLIADLLVQTMQKQGWIEPVAGWQALRQQRYREHLETLDAPYYARGKEHLDGLKRWTQGRTKKLRSPPITE